MLPLENASFARTRTPEFDMAPYAPEPLSRRFRDACQQIKQHIYTLGSRFGGRFGETGYRECEELMSHVDGITRLAERLDDDEPWSQSISRLLLLIVDRARAAAESESVVELKLADQINLDPKQLARVGCVLHEAVARALKSRARDKALGPVVCSLSSGDGQCILSVRQQNKTPREYLSGLGIRLMIGLARQLNGTLELHPLEPGACLELTFPTVVAVSAGRHLATAAGAPKSRQEEPSLARTDLLPAVPPENYIRA